MNNAQIIAAVFALIMSIGILINISRGKSATPGIIKPPAELPPLPPSATTSRETRDVQDILNENEERRESNTSPSDDDVRRYLRELEQRELARAARKGGREKPPKG